MKLLVLVNPCSRGGKAQKKWSKYRSNLPAHDAVMLENIDQARELAATAAGYDVVAVCGGDGTVNAVADGVLRNPDQNLKFAVLYAGTSPDFCKFHQIPVAPSPAALCLKRGAVTEVRALTANGNHFFCSCNLGMGAAVAAQSNRLRPRLGDKLGTLCALLQNLLKSKPQTYLVNGERIAKCDHLLVTRMPYIAGGLRLHLPALKEEEYAIWILQDTTRLQRLLLPWHLYRGKPVGTVRVVTGTTRIDAESGGKVEYDGDPHGELPIEIKFSDRKLNLITKSSPATKDNIKTS